MPKQRPSIVTWLALAVLILAGANLIAVISGIMRWQDIAPLRLGLPLAALLILPAIWTAIWIVIGWGLFTLRQWARLALPVAFLVYEVTVIGQQILFARQTYTRERLPFAVITALVCLLIILFVISRTRVREAFRRQEPISNSAPLVTE